MIRGVDCAYPQPTYPSWAQVVCGYAGGHTAHQWAPAEVAAVRESGRVWLAIWTARNAKGQPPLIGQDGATDAANMAAQLPAYGYNHTLPVFYDIEPGIYDLNPTGAQAAIAQWKTGMHTAGYPNAYVYTIKRQDGDWIADWTNIEPATIPAGKVGVQYGGDALFDYNVFTDNLLLGDDMGWSTWTPQEQEACVDAVWSEPVTYPDGATITARQRLAEIDHHVGVDIPGQLAAINAQLAAIAAKLP